MSLSTSAWAVSTTVVISQIYTAGGNNGATYNADYVELFNLSGSPVSLSGYALQYASAAGTAGSVIALPAGITLQPGQRYLIQGTPSATNGVALPSNADVTLSGLAMGASAGKIYLTNSTVALTNVCSGASIVDFVGYGSTASCYEGSAAATAPTTTMAAIRTNPCSDTDNNGADFSDGTPSPRNSASAPTPCGSVASASLGLSAMLTPTSVYGGSATLLAATVTPATSPASTGFVVTADTSALGGSSSQTLYDDGTHGDITAGDNVYSLSLTVPSGQAANVYSINFSVKDNQSRTAAATAKLTVLAPVSYVAIHTIQGNTPGSSPYSGQTVTTSGVVTGIVSNGFYLQAKDTADDSDPTTPEGIFVHTGSGNVPSLATVGTELQVTGTVALYPTTSMTPGTELDTPAGFTVLSTNQPLPAPVVLTTTFPSSSGGVTQLMRYQSMRVSVPSFTVTEPTQGTLTETNETYVSNGQFYGTVTGVARPVREPGLEVLDPLTATEPSSIPRFDDNPELFEVDSLAMLGGTAGPIDVASGAVLTNMTGVMDFSAGSPLFTIDATTRPTVSGGMTVTAVPAPKAGEITIGDQNMERFYNDIKDTSGATVVTTAAYQLRLSKASLAIRNVLGDPDILCLEEIENIAVLNDLTAKISADAATAGQTDPHYVPYLVQGNDTSGINVAFLVNPSKIDVTDVSQFGKTTMFTNSTGAQAILNDRPPLVLHAGIKRTGTSDYPITVIVNHLRSLNGVTDSTTTGQTVRIKREQQAEFLANLIQGYQAAGEHVISVGDYNAFEFSDGLVDSLGIIKGQAASASQVVVPGPSGLVSPPLVDLAPTNVANGVYSYVYVGNAQSIDHFLATQDIAGLIHTAPAHFDADFPLVDRNDANRPEASSDHDGIVGYLAVPGTTSLMFTPATLSLATQVVNTSSAAQSVTVLNSGSAAIHFTSITASAGFSQTNNCVPSLAGGASCTINVTFKPTASGPATGSITLVDDDVTGTQTIGLTGTGAGIYSAIALSSLPSSAVAGSTVTLNASVSGNAGSTPTGMVTFLDGTTTLGTATLSGGTASFATSTLAVGTHSITATYGGDANYPGITATAITVTITAAPVPDFTLSVANSSVLVSQSVTSGTTTVSIAMTNGFNQPVTFACSGLPANSHCTFNPVTLKASGSSTLTVTIDSVSAQAQHVVPFGGPLSTVAFLLVPVWLLRRKKLASHLLRGIAAMLVLGVVFVGLSGCGSGSSAKTASGMTSVSVTATGGGTSHSATFTLNVQ